MGQEKGIEIERIDREIDRIRIDIGIEGMKEDVETELGHEVDTEIELVKKDQDDLGEIDQFLLI